MHLRHVASLPGTVKGIGGVIEALHKKRGPWLDDPQMQVARCMDTWQCRNVVTVSDVSSQLSQVCHAQRGASEGCGRGQGPLES